VVTYWEMLPREEDQFCGVVRRTHTAMQCPDWGPQNTSQGVLTASFVTPSMPKLHTITSSLAQ
jgi:hypothetical protein